MAEINLKAIRVTETNLEQFGNVFAKKEGQQPDNQGTGWQCWYPLGRLHNEEALMIGLVKTNLAVPVIEKVECHPTRSEWVYAIDKPIIQVVALSSKTPETLADAATAKAIILNPGEGIVIHAGVWHAPAFAADLTEAIYGFVLAKAAPNVEELGMVRFDQNNVLRIQ